MSHATDFGRPWNSGEIVFMRSTVRWRLVVFLVALVLAGPGTLRAESPPDTWIVVTPPALAGAVAPLVDARKARGLRVVQIDAHAVLGPDARGPLDGKRLRAHLRRELWRAGGAASVLLVGAMSGDPAVVVPGLPGRIGDMKDVPTDNAYGCVDADLLPDVAVGRFPARTVEEAEAMVAKTLAFEARDPRAAWTRRITLLVGHPGGPTPLVQRLSEGIVGGEVQKSLPAIHPRWRPRAILHMPSSPFALPDGLLAPTARLFAESGAMLVVYLGHSGAGGLSSNGVRFLRSEDWASMDMTPGNGLLLSCGCHTCELGGFLGEGFGVAAMRNPSGPVAVVGAHGLSAGAMGKLAFEGLLPLLGAEEPPRALGAWWLAMKRGLAEGPIGPLVFELYDRADGSNGRVPLEVQRLEHLERWMLLGDPATALPIAPLDVRLEVEGRAAPGGTLVVHGTLSTPSTGAEVVVTLERPFGSEVPDLPALPDTPGEDREKAMLERSARANDVVLARETAAADGPAFTCRLRLPDVLPWARVTVRVRASGSGEEGVVVLDTAR